MARPCSNDLRERVAAAVASGRRCREVATLFKVSVASVVKWSQRQRATGSAAAKRMGGHRKRLLEPHRALVIERLTAVPDLTLKALVAELGERGITTCPVSVWRLVRSEGMSFKKKPVRRGAGAASGRQMARAVEEVSGPASSPTPRLHRRDLGENQHGADPRLVAARPKARCARSVRQMAHAHLSCRTSPRPDRRALRARRADQR